MPLALCLVLTATLLMSFWITHSVQYHRMVQLYWERIYTRYAAESVLATIQATQMRKKGEKMTGRMKIMENDEFVFQGKRIVYHVQDRGEKIHVKVVAYGQWDVKQTIEAELDPISLEIQRWIR